MPEDHFSRQTLERFARSELSRKELRNLVRHLLRLCPQCSRLVREMSQREDFQLLLLGLDAGESESEPQLDRGAPARVARFVSRVDRASP